MRAVVSIHDVMPHTLGDVDAQLALLARHGIHTVTLLVVPGKDWRTRDVARLRAWQRAGHELAGHGWHHHAAAIRGWRHHVHSWLLSRHAAEHLALSPTAIDARVRRCFAWFDDRGLQHPALYVPPAWGLGALPPQRLRATGFRYLETLGTVHDLISGRRRHLPVLGFEADTRLRAGLLRGLNSVSAHWPGPVRLALHPHDHRLRLAGALGARLRRVRETVDYATLLAPAALR